MIVPMTCRTAVIALAVAGALASACDIHHGGSWPGNASDTWTNTYTLAPGGELQIVNSNGTIDVQAGSGPGIEVKADRIVHARSDAQAQSMASKVKIAEEIAADKIVVRTEGLGGVVLGAEIEVQYHVTVPAATRLRLRTGNGAVSVANLEGSVVASVENGDLTGTNLEGGVDMRTTNGAVTVTLAAVGQDPVDLRAVNGAIELTMPKDANANIAANVRNGQLDLGALAFEPLGEQTKQRARGRLNAGGTPVEVSTINGNLTIKGN
jgi:hypothetical protein